MMIECTCGWTASTAAFSGNLQYCPECGGRLTIRNTDEHSDHGPEPEDDDADDLS